MNADRRRIDREAVAWLARQEAGFSAAEAEAFARWRATDPRHGRSFEAIESSWQSLDRLRGSEVSSQLEAELDELPARGKPRFASASNGWSHFLQSSWKFGAIAAGLIVMVAYFSGGRSHPGSVAHTETIVTDVGGARILKLPDGSLIRLNTGSAIEIQFTATERRARLNRGEAFFEVAKNPARPFIVSGAGVDVRAVGTEFNVRIQAGLVEVIVREGAVRVDGAADGKTLLASDAPTSLAADNPSPLLSAGKRVEVLARSSATTEPAFASPVAVNAAEIERALSWQNHRLDFDAVPLSTIVAEFNRYNRRALILDDAVLSSRRFGGTFQATDPATFVTLLQTSYNVVTEERPEGTVLRLRQ